MTGFGRLFYALAETALEALSRVFLFPAERLRAAAAWCHEQSLPGA